MEKIIEAFRNGTHSEAEFWLEIGGKFIYIIYTAVRDEKGNFRGVLEMMQDVTHIRSLTGSQRLLTWEDIGSTTDDKSSETKVETTPEKNKYNITKDTNIGSLIKQYPYLKDFLVSLSPKFEKLKSPILFKTMSSVATLDMVSSRGGFDTSDLINKLVGEIDRRTK